MNIDISTQLFYYVDIVLVFAGAGALLWALYYYRIINRLQKSIISQDRNRLLPSSTFLFFISFVVIGYRLLTKHGVFLGTFAYYEDTLSSALLFSSAIFILYATHIFRKTFLEINNEFSMVFENVSVGIHTVGPKGTIDSFNPKFLKISGGKRAEDLLGKRISDVPIYRNTGLDVIAQNAFSEQKQFDVETSLPPDVSGKRTYYHFLGVPVVVAEDGAAKRMVVLAEDVTSRKQLEEDIKQHSEDLEGQRIILENVAENMPTGVILLDTAGKPVLMNNALRIFLGCSTDDVKKAYGRFLEKFSTIQINGLVEACLSGTPIKVPEVEIDNKTISLSSTCMTALNPKQKLGNIFLVTLFGWTILRSSVCLIAPRTILFPSLLMRCVPRSQLFEGMPL